MKALKLAAVAALLSQLAGCFVFIPGSVVGKITDTITGAEGEHCVTRDATVGSTVRDGISGDLYVVKSLSGSSVKCADPRLPIRAALALQTKSARSAPESQDQAQVSDDMKRFICREYNRAQASGTAAEKDGADKAMKQASLTPLTCKVVLIGS